MRFAWLSGTYSGARASGSGGGTIRFKEGSRSADAGLAKAGVAQADQKKYGAGLSYADLYTLAGVSAISQMGGPKIGWGHGRVGALDPSAVTPTAGSRRRTRVEQGDSRGAARRVRAHGLQ